jgi:hypothetical protein
MTRGGPAQQSGLTPLHFRPPAGQPPRRAWRWVVASAVVISVLVGIGLAISRAGTQLVRPPSGYRQGDCVVIKAQERDGELHADAAKCNVDPSFTVAKIANQSGDCGADNYTRIRPPFSDVATGRLCLVPNLVVGHCYRFGVPKGMWDLVGCAATLPAAVKITKQVDSGDAGACRDETESLVPGIRTVQVPRQLQYATRTYCYGEPDE